MRFKLLRTINDEEHIEGIATFKPTVEPNVMIYEESGTRQNGLEFCRSNIYKFYPGRIEIYMVGEEHPMHDLVFAFNDGKYQARHVHKCGNDLYDCRFEILSDSAFKVDYNVTEPNKQYKVSTTYKNLDTGVSLWRLVL